MRQPGYWPFMPAGTPERPLLVMLHGFLGRGQDWRPFTDALGSDYYIKCPDLPGHGGNKLYQQRDDVVTEMQTVCHEPCSLVGYSMGARIALQFAIERPDAVTRLVLESVHPGIEDEHQREERLKHDLAIAEQLRAIPDHDSMEQWLQDWYAGPLWESLRARPELLEEVIQKRRVQYRSSLAWGLEAMSIGRQENLWPRLGELTMPTLVIAGELDTKYASIAQRMAEMNPNIAVMIVSGAGHNVHLEAPATYTKVIASFLKV